MLILSTTQYQFAISVFLLFLKQSLKVAKRIQPSGNISVTASWYVAIIGKLRIWVYNNILEYHTVK